MADDENTELATADAEQAKAEEAAKDKPAKSDGGGCCGGKCTCVGCLAGFGKSILFILLIPIFIVLIVVAVVVYIVTLPLKCCSPCFAPCLIGITELVKKIAMLPYNLMRWVCGKKPVPVEETKKVNEGEGKDYGTSGDAAPE